MKKMIVAALLVLTGVVFSQDGDFGKNKVQYKPFNWSYIQTDHFDIYFYDGGLKIATFTAAAAESAYASISKSIRYQLNNRVPIMVYNSHNDFQQTNVVGEYLEEGIGGVTELFKNRVVLPFEGNYRQFRHVIHHELVHAVLNDMFYGGSIQSIISNNIRIQLPMWMNEGLAEHEALKWDINSDMFMSDATIHTYLPPIQNLGGYFAYRGGQSVWYYIANKYGEQKIAEILHRIKGARSIDDGFKSAIGLSVKELSERWQKEQKVLYWPDIAKREEPADFATQITDHRKENDFYNTSPAISPQGDKIAFISDRDDYFDVFVVSTIDNKIKKVVDGQQTKNFEELHLLTPGMAWSPDGKRIALAVKSGEHDAIFLIDVDSGDEEKLEFDLDGIFSVDWSRQGDKIAFVGNTSYQSDIYTYDLNTKKLVNLTDDIFSDSDPKFSPDGTKVYFVSDRRDFVKPLLHPNKFKIAKFDYSQEDIYSIDLATNTMQRVIEYDKSDETSPVLSPDGTKMLYVSDRSGIGNVYERDLKTGEDRPITNSITGVYQLSLSADANKLVFSSLNYAGFDIFMMKTPFEKKLAMASIEPTEYIKRKNLIAAEAPDTSKTDSVSQTPKDTTSVYGNNIRIDFNNYVFSDDAARDKEEPYYETAAVKDLAVTNNMDADSNYIVNKYKLNFTPDIIYGNAAFSTFYGVQGTTMMAFSDMLGDHQIYFLTNLLLDLKNSDYVFAYYYLPKLIDWGIQGYHSARFLYNYGPDGNVYLYRFRMWGATLSASLPLDRFNRFEGSLGWMNLLRENLDYVNDPSQSSSLVIPSFSYVHDNTLWGYTSPNNGTRYNINAMFSPKYEKSALDFQTYSFDYRTYMKFWSNYVFVTRFSGGASLGSNPQRFFIGGTDGWINRQFENNTIPINSIADYAFLTPVLPLRGYNYNVKNGTKFGLMNYELRYPFIQYLVTGGVPIAFNNITGATFLDVGSAWTDNNAYRILGKDQNGSVVTQDLLVGTGFGLRMIMFGLPLKLDVAWSYNYNNFSPPKYYFSLGSDF